MNIRSAFRNLFLVVVTLSVTSALYGQDTLKISLDKAIEIALSENRTIKIADKEIERKGYALKEKRAGLIPELSGMGQYTRTFLKQKMVMDVPGMGVQTFSVGIPNQYNAGFNLSLPVIAPTLWQNIKLTEVDIERSVEASRTSRLDLVKEVKSAYYQSMLSQDSHDVLKKSYDQAVENARIIRERFNQGTASEYDLLRSEVTVKNYEPNLLQSEKAVELSNLRLKVLIGVDLNEKINTQGSLADYEYQLTAESINTNFSLANNPNLRKIDLEEKYLQRSYKALRAQRLPTLSMAGTFAFMSMNDHYSFGDYYWSSYSNASLSLSIPIFDGLAKNHREKQTKIAIQTLKMQKDDLERNLSLSVENANQDIQKSIKQIASNKEGVEMAKKGYRIAIKRYETGAGTYIEMNDAELALVQSALTYHQAIYDYLVAKSELENTLGAYPIK